MRENHTAAFIGRLAPALVSISIVMTRSCNASDGFAKACQGMMNELLCPNAGDVVTVADELREIALAASGWASDTSLSPGQRAMARCLIKFAQATAASGPPPDSVIAQLQLM